MAKKIEAPVITSYPEDPIELFGHATPYND